MLIKIIEFLPVIVFFMSYRLTSNLITATALVVGSCIAAAILEWIIAKKVSRMQIFLTCAVILFGVPTVLLNNPEIIKWKVTVVNLILAAAIFVCLIIFKKNPLSYLIGREVSLPDAAWGAICKMWMVFFVFAAGLNVIIAFYLPDLFGISEQEAESLWVSYKTFGNAILNFAFAIVCGVWLIKAYPEVMEEAAEKQSQSKK